MESRALLWLLVTPLITLDIVAPDLAAVEGWAESEDVRERTLAASNQALNWREWGFEQVEALARELASGKPVVRLCLPSTLTPYTGLGGKFSAQHVEVAFYVRNVKVPDEARPCIFVNGHKLGCGTDADERSPTTIDLGKAGTYRLTAQLIDMHGNVVATTPEETVVELQPDFDQFLADTVFSEHPSIERHRVNQHRVKGTKTALMTAMAQKYMTDKSQEYSFGTGHAFKYDKILQDGREKVEQVFEIGTYRGGSLRMWADYFPNAKVYGFDRNLASNHTGPRFKTMMGDNCIRDSLDQTMAEIASEGGPKTADGEALFDVIIEDGGHQVECQMLSLGMLFKHVKPGGWYIMEDVGSSFLSSCCGEHTYYDSPHYAASQYLDSKPLASKFWTEFETALLNQEVEELRLIEIPNRLVSVELAIHAEQKTPPCKHAPKYPDGGNFPHGGSSIIIEIKRRSYEL